MNAITRKSLLKSLLGAEAILYLTTQIFERGKPFIKHMDAWILGPGFLGTMFLLLYQEHENAMLFKKLSIFFMIISAFVYALLFYPVLKFGFTETTPPNTFYIIVTILNLICNMIAVFQYEK